MLAAAGRKDDRVSATASVRAIRRRELLRIAAADLCGLADVAEVGEGLTEITHATLEATLMVATRVAEHERGAPVPTRMAIVSMGRLGGHEIGYGSDADVMFVHEPLPGADPSRGIAGRPAVANEVRRLLALPGRPGARGRRRAAARGSAGRAGAHARLLRGVLRQVVGGVGGPGAAAGRGGRRRRRAVRAVHRADRPASLPRAGLGEADVREVRRIKARVDEERLPRGADRSAHLKLGRGGLGDIEWTVQLLQMRHAGQVPGLRTTRTLLALKAAREAGLVAPEQSYALAESWRLASRARNAMTLVRGTSGDQLPRDVRDLAAVSAVLGYEPGETETMTNDLRRVMRRARAVVDQIFWD